MRLSIIIPLYNKEKYIERCLKSLLEQDIPESDYEIIIVDDGSKDSGGAIALDYAEKHANIIFFSQKNAGPSAARNRGLYSAKGDYLYFLDADDFLAKNVLGTLLEIAEQNNLEILEFDTKELKEGEIIDDSPNSSPDLNLIVMDGTGFIAKYNFRDEAWRYFISRKFLSESGLKFIEDTLYEDVILTVSLFIKTSRIAKVALDVHRYVTVENSIVTSKNPEHNLRRINGILFLVEKISDAINGLNKSHPNYNEAVKKLRMKQHAFVFAFIVRTFKYPLINIKDLKEILLKMKKLEAYPLDPELGGIGNGRFVYNRIFVPIFNNEISLVSSMRIRRLFSFR